MCDVTVTRYFAARPDDRFSLVDAGQQLLGLFVGDVVEGRVCDHALHVRRLLARLPRRFLFRPVRLLLLEVVVEVFRRPNAQTSATVHSDCCVRLLRFATSGTSNCEATAST